MRSTRSLALAAAVGLAAIVAVVLVARDGGGGGPSFSRDVAPILADKCAGCHQAGGIAPFSLESAPTARSRAAAIAAAVESGRMPPWPPGPTSPAYVGEEARTLSDEQRATLVEWARSGGRVDGEAREARPLPRLQAGTGERLVSLGLPRPYVPSGEGDDYRCFLLEPGLDVGAFVTAAEIRPGAARVVHHVILFRATAEQMPEARQLDRRSSGQGWPCFGGTGLGADVDTLSDAGWVAAWAPGGEPVRYPDGVGMPLPAGGGIVMQVHYNLLAGRDPDRTVVSLALSEDGAIEPAATMLVPGPIELECAPEESGPLCDRTAAVEDLARKRGRSALLLPAGLQLLCGGNPFAPPPSAVSTCERPFETETTIHGVAGHMHLLGRSIKVELNPGTDDAQVLLEIPRWDFHWQNAYRLAEPVTVGPDDRVRVTCRHDPSLRDPELEPRYVVWGEGTTDEMCLGVLQVTRS